MAREEPASLNRTEMFVRFQAPPSENSDALSEYAPFCFAPLTRPGPVKVGASEFWLAKQGDMTMTR